MSNQICRYYPKCTNKFCTFSHPKTGNTQKLCTFFQRGVCNQGENCKFLHPTKEPSGSSAKAQHAATESAKGPEAAIETNNATEQAVGLQLSQDSASVAPAVQPIPTDTAAKLEETKAVLTTQQPTGLFTVGTGTQPNSTTLHQPIESAKQVNLANSGVTAPILLGTQPGTASNTQQHNKPAEVSSTTPAMPTGPFGLGGTAMPAPPPGFPAHLIAAPLKTDSQPFQPQQPLKFNAQAIPTSQPLQQPIQQAPAQQVQTPQPDTATAAPVPIVKKASTALKDPAQIVQLLEQQKREALDKKRQQLAEAKEKVQKMQAAKAEKERQRKEQQLSQLQSAQKQQTTPKVSTPSATVQAQEKVNPVAPNPTKPVSQDYVTPSPITQNQKQAPSAQIPETPALPSQNPAPIVEERKVESLPQSTSQSAPQTGLEQESSTKAPPASAQAASSVMAAEPQKGVTVPSPRVQVEESKIAAAETEQKAHAETMVVDEGKQQARVSSSSYLEFVKGDNEPLSPASFKKSLIEQAKLLRSNELRVSEKLAALIKVSFKSSEDPQVGVKRPREQDVAQENEVDPKYDAKRQKTGDDPGNPESTASLLAQQNKPVPGQTTVVLAQPAATGRDGGLSGQASANQAGQQADKPAGAADADKQSQVQPETATQPAAPGPVRRTTVSAREIQADLDEWDKKLDMLEKMLGIARKPDQNPDAILANPYVDSLISFETKVMYLSNYFEAKHAQVIAAKK